MKMKIINKILHWFNDTIIYITNENMLYKDNISWNTMNMNEKNMNEKNMDGKNMDGKPNILT